MKLFTGARCLSISALLICPLAVLSMAHTASAQNPLERYPQNYKSILDNAQVAVLRVHYGPHESVPVHDHSDLPTLFVYLNNSGPVQFNMHGVPPSTMVRPSVQLGAFRYSPGRVERHSVQNLSDTSSEFLRIELKQFPLEGGESFRNDPPVNLAVNSISHDFINDQIEVDRVLCKAGSECSVPADPLPTLLVGLSAAHYSALPDSTAQTISLGDVRWIEPQHALRISAIASGPAHLMRILVKSPKPHRF